MSFGVQVFGGMFLILVCAYLIVSIWECGRDTK